MKDNMRDANGNESVYSVIKSNVRELLTNDQYDYKREIEELKNMIMYLDENKNVHDLISLQAEIGKQFGNLIQMKIQHDYESKQDKADDLADGLFQEHFI